MSTHNIDFHVEIRRISILFCWKKSLLWSYLFLFSFFFFLSFSNESSLRIHRESFTDLTIQDGNMHLSLTLL